MSYLIICPLSQLHDTAQKHQPRDLITIMNVGTEMERPKMIAEERHHYFGFNDIIEAQDNLISPNAEHVEKLITLAKEWSRENPLLIHCFMGISRSTACAYSIACALMPNASEEKIAKTLRNNAPSATPNKLMVALADEYLKREGRMIKAIEAIGRGAEAFEGTPFTLPIE